MCAGRQRPVMGLDLALRVLIVGLGGWRIASLFVNEDGVGDVFARLRDRVFPAPGGEFGAAGKLLSCVWCFTPWSSTVLWLAWEIHPAFAAVPATWGVALLVERVMTR